MNYTYLLRRIKKYYHTQDKMRCLQKSLFNLNLKCDSIILSKKKLAFNDSNRNIKI